MAVESTVLLVSPRDLPKALVTQLEGAGVFVEATRPEELSQVFAVVSPDLVVHFGAEHAEDVVTLVAAGPDARRVRLVLVVEREAVAELRKTNRSVVASILSDDMPETTLVDRVVALARKSAQGAQAGKLSLAPARPARAVTPSPVPTLSRSAVPRPLTSRAPLAPRVASRVPTLDGPSAGATGARVVPDTATPIAKASPLTSHAAGAVPPRPHAALPALPAVAVPATSAFRVSPPAVVKPPPAPTPPPSSDRGGASQKNGGQTTSTNQRLVLVDDDVTRGDAVAAALRVLGFSVQLSPSDPARTRWAVLRKFGPNTIITDGSAAPQAVWMELLRADAHLRKAEVITAPYRRLYEDNTGALNLQPLLARLGGQPDSLSLPEQEVSANDVELEAESDDDDDRPTLVVDEPTESPQLAVTTQNARSTFVADTIAPGEPTVVIPDVGDDEPTKRHDLLDFQALASHRQNVRPPTNASTDGASDSALSAAAVTMTERPAPKKKSRALSLGLIGVLAIGGGYVYSRRPTRMPNAAVAAPQIAAPSAAPASKAPSDMTAAAPTKEAEALAAAPSTRSAVDLWKASDDGSVPDCDTLVTSKDELRKGDVAQSGLFWDKARSALVLGDFKQAQAHLCRAVFIYGQSLAVEALAENYLGQHALTQAKNWIEVALVNRPGRPKALELLGDIESQRGNASEAKKAWAEALQVDEADQKTLDAVAKQQIFEANQAIKASNLGRAEVVLRRAATLSPASSDAADGLARVYTAQKDDARAALWSEEAKKRGSP